MGAVATAIPIARRITDSDFVLPRFLPQIVIACGSVSNRSGVSVRLVAVLCTRKDSKILILSSWVEVVFGEL
jgi:hypothetical protein